MENKTLTAAFVSKTDFTASFPSPAAAVGITVLGFVYSLPKYSFSCSEHLLVC